MPAHLWDHFASEGRDIAKINLIRQLHIVGQSGRIYP